MELLKNYMGNGNLAQLREDIIGSDIAGLYNFVHFNEMDGPSELFNNARERATMGSADYRYSERYQF